MRRKWRTFHELYLKQERTLRRWRFEVQKAANAEAWHPQQIEWHTVGDATWKESEPAPQVYRKSKRMRTA